MNFFTFPGPILTDSYRLLIPQIIELDIKIQPSVSEKVMFSLVVHANFR